MVTREIDSSPEPVSVSHTRYFTPMSPQTQTRTRYRNERGMTREAADRMLVPGQLWENVYEYQD